MTTTTSKAGTLSIRRILVALDASPQSLAALRAAVELSVKLEAELLGLFVEDIELLRLADSPYARDLLLPTARETPLNRASMERKLKAQAEQVRKALAAVANPAKVAWSFRVVRGRVPSEILTAAAEYDLLALGRIGWSLVRKSGVGSTALAALSEAVPALLLSSRATLAERPVLVWCDGTPESVRGVLAAAELAQIGSGKLTVLLPPSGQGTSNHLRKQVVDLLEETDIRVHYRHVHSSNEAGFRGAVQSEHPSMIVLTGTEPFSDKASLVALLDQMGVSALFLSQTPFHNAA
jgi:nucleotide-binding universal stress UspA family protein